jgi:hypothetical protein
MANGARLGHVWRVVSFWYGRGRCRAWVCRAWVCRAWVCLGECACGRGERSVSGGCSVQGIVRRWQYAVCRVGCAECGVQSAECGVRRGERGVRCGECGVPGAELFGSGQWAVGSGQWAAGSWQGAGCRTLGTGHRALGGGRWAMGCHVRPGALRTLHTPNTPTRTRKLNVQIRLRRNIFSMDRLVGPQIPCLTQNPPHGPQITDQRSPIKDQIPQITDHGSQIPPARHPRTCPWYSFTYDLPFPFVTLNQ